MLFRSESLTEVKLLRETELGRWRQQRAELLSQIKIQDLRIKEENKKFKVSLATSADESAVLKVRLASLRREYEGEMKNRQADFRKEATDLRSGLDKAKAEAAEARKASAEEKRALTEEFSNKARQQEDRFNEDRIKMTAELGDLRDINRALEEELASIRSKLEIFKKGMRE